MKDREEPGVFQEREDLLVWLDSLEREESKANLALRDHLENKDQRELQVIKDLLG